VRAITKGNEPKSLTTYRAQNNPPSKTAFKDFPEKEALRGKLIAEQKGLCCYCMARIENDPLKMKIDHWQCQDRYQDGRLSYSNMLGACLGGSEPENKKPRRDKSKLHCDSRKENKDLKWNPANPLHVIESRISYTSDGYIKSSDPEFDLQLDDVLNLNISFLRSNRKAVLEVVAQWWKNTPDARQKLQQQIDKRTNNAGLHQPFSPVAIWFLRKKLEGPTA
jgi:uncharacterized protein (TIGR02646 family)